MNKAVLIGRLAAEPELRQTTGGVSVTTFTIAVDRPYTKGAERQTDWIDVVAWRNTAEFVCKFFHKGSPIVVEGSIQTKSRENRDGTKTKSVEIRADNVEFVPKTSTGSSDRPQEAVSDEGRQVLHQEPKEVYAVEQTFAQGNEEDFQTVTNEDLPF